MENEILTVLKQINGNHGQAFDWDNTEHSIIVKAKTLAKIQSLIRRLENNEK